MRSLAWKSGILFVLDLGSVADGTAKRKTIYTEGHEAHKEMNTGGQSTFAEDIHTRAMIVTGT
jgi:hypothetical protein